MDAGSLGSINWGLVALLVSVAACLVYAVRFFRRENRKDLDSLKETLQSADEEDDEDRRA